MSELTFDQVKSIVDEGRWDELINCVEGQYLECKTSCPDLSNNEKKLELAKDVSSFANAKGGFILFGVETIKDDTHSVDRIAKLRPFPPKHFDKSQYSKIVEDWIIPSIQGLQCEWKDNKDGEGFAVIEIPQQTEQNKPFVMSKTELGREILIGYAERKMDRNEPTKPKDIAVWLRNGRNYQHNIESRLDRLIELTRQHKENTSSINKDEVIRRIGEAINDGDFANRPYYSLAAYSTSAVALATIFENEKESIKSTLETPPVIRRGGFSLETLDRAKIIKGQFLQVSSGKKKLIRLYRDGMLILVVSADSDFLSWGRTYRMGDGETAINSVALIEVTYLFCLFYEKVLNDMIEPTEKIRFLLRLGNMGGNVPIHLNPHSLKSNSFMFYNGQHKASGNEWTSSEIEVATNTYDSKTIAYNLIQEVYVWFGVEPSAIPYSEQFDRVWGISPEQIKTVQ